MCTHVCRYQMRTSDALTYHSLLYSPETGTLSESEVILAVTKPQ